jgi:hypothetical protein
LAVPPGPRTAHQQLPAPKTITEGPARLGTGARGAR